MSEEFRTAYVYVRNRFAGVLCETDALLHTADGFAYIR